MPDQIFEVSEIPSSLWDSSQNIGAKTPSGVLSLPDLLCSAYRETLQELGLMTQAEDLANRDESCVGGAREQESYDHFAWNYSGSCGRTQLFCLDPHHTFKTTRDAIASIFSGGYVTILDIPSGAGSGTATLLSIIAQLRQERILPPVDLDIRIVGGDISETSRSIAESIFGKMHDSWVASGIDVSHQFLEWDVLSDESTGDLIAAWEETFDGRPGLLLGNNFSGFLGTRTDPSQTRLWIDEAETPLRQIFTTVARQKFSAFWLEPTSNDATKRMYPKLDTILSRYSRVVRAFPGYRGSSAELADPIVTDGHFAVRATGTHLKPQD